MFIIDSSNRLPIGDRHNEKVHSKKNTIKCGNLVFCFLYHLFRRTLFTHFLRGGTRQKYVPKGRGKEL